MKLSISTKRAVAAVAAAAILGAPGFFGNLSASTPSGTSKERAGAGPDTWRLGEPVRYENLTIFPLISKSEADTSRFETLDEGLASGDVLVTEQGSEYLHRSRGIQESVPARQYNPGPSVNQLVLINRGKRPVLLLAGELVSGGNQDRIVAKDRIVPIGGEPLPLDVFCVEHGRWTGESTKFGAANVMVHPSVREKAAIESDQSQVWNAVRSGSTSTVARAATAPSAGMASPPSPSPLSAGAISSAIATAAPTQAYRKIYQSPQISRSVEEFVNEVDRRFTRANSGLKGEGVVGVVVAYGGEVVWSDAFASPALFRQYWPKLLRSYAVEALARPATKEQASLEDARAFLERANGHVREESEPGVYVWRERTQGQYSEIELDALAPDNLLLHWMKVLRTN